MNETSAPPFSRHVLLSLGAGANLDVSRLWTGRRVALADRDRPTDQADCMQIGPRRRHVC